LFDVWPDVELVWSYSR